MDENTEITEDKPVAEAEPAESEKPKRRGRKKAELDRTRKYATVHGVNTSARFYQDGRFFNVDGQPCEL